MHVGKASSLEGSFRLKKIEDTGGVDDNNWQF